MDLSLIIVWITTFAGYLVYRKLKGIYDDLESLGIPYEGAGKGWLTMLKIFSVKENFLDSIIDQYNRFKGQQIVPSFSLTKRAFMIRDAAFIKQITIKDFDTFVNHDKNLNPDMDKLSGRMLFALFDDEWRNMRNILSPIFTSSKMKMMFGILSDCTNDFIKHYEEKARGTGNVIINCKESFSRYTVDGICSAVLGFKGDCIKNEDSELFKFTMSLQKVDFWMFVKVIIFMVAHKLYVLLKLQLTRKDVHEFFYNAIVKVMKEREEKGIFRPDVIQLLMQAKKGQLEMQDKENEVNEAELSNFSANIEYDVKAKSTKMTNWTDEHYMAQGLIFFLAGFDTTNILLQVTTYSLAKNRDIQQRLIDEVDDVIAGLDGAYVTYEALHKMKYLDMVISEALRFWPPAGVISRECSKDYKLKLDDGKIIKLRNSDIVTMPIYSIHHDERYYEEPEKFDPERFSDERKGSIVDGSYIPFGSGPRVCIGSRFALLEAKLLLFNILSKFTFEVCDKTPEKLELAASLSNFELKDPIVVGLKLRN